MTTPVFIDTETLGLDPRIHRVWEVAAIVDDVEHLWHLALPHDAEVDPVAAQISGFHERYAEAVTTPVPMFLDQFLELTDGRHLCGAVVSFDEERLRRLAWQWNRTPSWHYHLIDVEALALGYLAGIASDWRGPERRMRLEAMRDLPWKSDDLTRMLGLKPPSDEDRHTALGDARWAKAIYERVMGA